MLQTKLCVLGVFTNMNCKKRAVSLAEMTPDNKYFNRSIFSPTRFAPRGAKKNIISAKKIRTGLLLDDFCRQSEGRQLKLVCC